MSITQKTTDHEHAAEMTLQRAIELKKASDLQSGRESAEEQPAEAERRAREANSARLNALLTAARERPGVEREEFDTLDRPDALKGHGFDLSAQSAPPDNFPEHTPSDELLIDGPPQKPVAEHETMDRHESFPAFGPNFISRAVITFVFVVVGAGAYLHLGVGGTVDDATAHNAPDAVTSPEQATAGDAARSESKDLPDVKPVNAIDRQTPQPPVPAPVIAIEAAEPARPATDVAPLSRPSPQELVPAASTEPPPVPMSASTQAPISVVPPDEPMIAPTRSEDVTNTLTRQAAVPNAKALSVLDPAIALRQNVAAPEVPARNPFRVEQTNAPPPLPVRAASDLPPVFRDVE